MSVPAIEAFQALRAVGQLFLRNSSASKITNSGTCWSKDLTKLSSQAGSTRAVELLCVSDRAILIPLASFLLSDWPSSFVSFCRETGVARMHFSGAYHLQPSWMTAVTDAHLAKQNRFVTQEMIATAVAEHQQEHGNPPTIRELRSQLKWSGEKGLADVFPPKRSTASEEEWLLFLQACNQLVIQVADKPLRARISAWNDLVAILLELLSAHGMPTSQWISRQDMANELAVGRADCIVDGTGLAELVDAIMHAMQEDMARSSRELYAERCSHRQAGKRFRELAAHLPLDLVRKVSVFLAMARNGWLKPMS